MERYVHDTDTHNLASPAEIVGILKKVIAPKSVVDVGCGTGTFLHQFKNAGVERVLGIDGPWANKELLAQNLRPEEFREKNLEDPIHIGEHFDLAICVEVAEHLHEKYAEILLASLTRLSEVVLFSAAIPFQDGQNHVNEQWIAYWVEKFDRLGYVSYDVLRPLLWNNKNVQWWYRQNIFLACKKGVELDLTLLKGEQMPDIQNHVHPELYLKNSARLERVLTGGENLLFYIKLIGKKLLRSRRAKL